MAAIQEKNRVVYFAPSRGRAYLTKRSAARAEAAAMIQKKYATQSIEYDERGRMTYSGFHWSESPALVKLHDRLIRMIMRSGQALCGKETGK